jgi:hypothetical protein
VSLVSRSRGCSGSIREHTVYFRGSGEARASIATLAPAAIRLHFARPHPFEDTCNNLIQLHQAA